MAWSFTDLRYGWKIATGIALASTTIYVANNTRWRVNQADVIELALGVDERVMALQTGTNAFGAPVYPVARPSFVRNWITNNYETQVVGGVTSVVAVAYTNTFTNTIGYRTDHAMMVELDAKMKEIVPYYVDTNSVYNGSTNIVMLTFTGLLAKLNIGDGTNFTRTPAIGTNAATYGELPWRIYVEDLQERYKVLNALKIGKPTVTGGWVGTNIFVEEHDQYISFSNLCDRADATFNLTSGTASDGGPQSFYGFLGFIVMFTDISVTRSHYCVGPFITNDLFEPYIKIEARSIRVGNTGPFGQPYSTNYFGGLGMVGGESNWVTILEKGTEISEWEESDDYGTVLLPSRPPYNNDKPVEGYYTEVRYTALYYFNFNYCTNKYW